MIRQSLGRSTLKYLQFEFKEPENRIKERLADVVHLFLPKTSEEDINKGISKFVDKAISLKRDVTEEGALYQFYWIDCEETSNRSPWR